jgi:squalene synthase HpnD/squalene synthase HpnC
MAVIETPSGKTASGENFPVGSWLIRTSLRPHVHALYRFARAADDVADNAALTPLDKVRRLDAMAAAIHGMPAAGVPAAANMRHCLRATGLAPQHCLDLLLAFRLDATKRRYADWSDLMGYCRYSAAPIGRHVLDLHGESRDTWPASDALCAALQVINHLQDCADDYRSLDRVYVPLNMLKTEHSDVVDLTRPAATPGLRRVIDTMLDRTEQLLVEAGALPGLVADRWLKLETAVIVALASRLVERLRREDPLAHPVKLSKTDLAQAAIKGASLALRGRDLGAADQADAQAITERVRASGTSFYLAMRLLPQKRRNAMYAIYAFCREVDDIADGTDELPAKLAALDKWRAEIDALYAGQPTHLVSRALADPVRRYGLRREDFLAVIDGMAMDSRWPSPPMTMAELDLYCDRVASAVGRLSVRAFGATEPAATHVAKSLGRALQLTNILRDVAEDAGLGRLYLPRELLAAHGITEEEPQAVLHHPALPLVCADLAETANRHFADAWSAMRLCRRRAMRPAAVMAAMYGLVFRQLQRHGWQASEARPKVPTLLKLWVVVRYGLI